MVGPTESPARESDDSIANEPRVARMIAILTEHGFRSRPRGDTGSVNFQRVWQDAPQDTQGYTAVDLLVDRPTMIRSEAALRGINITVSRYFDVTERQRLATDAPHLVRDALDSLLKAFDALDADPTDGSKGGAVLQPNCGLCSLPLRSFRRRDDGSATCLDIDRCPNNPTRGRSP